MKESPGAAGGAEAREVIVPRASAGLRVDRFLAAALHVSRAELQRWIVQGRVTVGGRACAPDERVREGERVVAHPMDPLPTQALPDENVHVAVVHVDEDIVVVDKPAGLVVHPARGHAEGTLVNGLLALGLFRPDTLVDQRPGIVHRLDKGTSGLMVVARTAFARERLKEQFQAHSIARAYLAIVVGTARDATFDTLHGRHPRDRLRFTTRVRSGKRAITSVRVLQALEATTFVECTLQTGRTHQIRVHLAEAGTPVLGDPLYGRPPRDAVARAAGARLGHQALHARLLGFVHPRSGQALRFESPPPADFQQALVALGGRIGGTAVED